MTQKTQVFLVNNKRKEPEFAAAFKKQARAQNIPFKEIDILQCGFSYTRTKNEINVYHKGKQIPLQETAWFIRGWAPSEDATALLCIILENAKIPFTDHKVNTKHEIRTSKLSQTFQLAAAQCPCPSTWVVPLKNFSLYAKKAAAALSFPLVVKARGGLGQRVWKCDSMTKLNTTISTLKKEGKDDLVILQEMIENQGDIRIVVFRDKTLAGILRQSSDGFLNNVSQGGTATRVAITAEEKRVARRAAKTLGLELAGVDVVRSTSGPLIFEVNKAPDITSFHAAAGTNIAQQIAVDYFKTL